MDVTNILFEGSDVIIINSEGGTHTISIDDDDPTLREIAENLVALGLSIIDTVPEDMQFDDDIAEFDDEDEFDDDFNY